MLRAFYLVLEQIRDDRAVLGGVLSSDCLPKMNDCMTDPIILGNCPMEHK